MISYDYDIMYAEYDIICYIMIVYTNIMDDIRFITLWYYSSFTWTDIRLNSMGYIIAYIHVRAETWLVMPAVSIAK